MNKKIFYLKLIIILAGSFFISNLLDREVFIAHSPSIRPDVVSNLAKKVSDPFKLARNYISSLSLPIFNQSPKEALKNVPFVKMAPGVYAKTERSTSYTMVNDNEVVYIEYRFNIDGKEIVVKVPQGMPAPTEDMFK